MSEESEQTTRSGKISLKDAFVSIASSLLELLKSKPFWRFIIIFSVISISAFLLLGIGFYLIVFGLLMTLVHLAAVYLPARRLLATIVGVPEEKSIQFSGPIWGKLFVLLPAVVWLGTATFGIWLLIRNGFMAQNIIYLLFFR